MPVADDRPPAGHEREPGIPPRPLVALAALALLGTTALAIWWLPAEATPEWAPPSPKPPTRSPATSSHSAVPVARTASTGPAGFLTHVDTARTPGLDLLATSARTGVRWFTLGHLTAGDTPCAPRWGGVVEPGDNPVANRIGRLRAGGGDAGLSFGGAGGRELASSCTDQAALTGAYRRAVGAFDAAYVDFEVRDSAEPGTVLRRARAVRSLQRETRLQGRPLRVTYTLPLGAAGLSEPDLRMLRTTRAAGADIGTVNLLAVIEPPSASADRMRHLATAVRAAHRQVAGVFPTASEEEVWHRLALTAVLAGRRDLSVADAGKLSAFAARTGLAWLSLRGTTPEPAAAQALWASRS
ncbi:hypothetical protein [Nonomuraea sp. NPDC046570]|uniref:hypothetical protein n=1 Tax=Nonomuraea sp. NPDC046570 TaxID=3155255 RepID=UPI0033ED9203